MVMRIGRVLAGALGVGGLVACSALVSAAEPTQQELVEQIKALTEKVEKLESAQSKAQAEPRADNRLDSRQVDATVDSVLRDADRRSALLDAEGFTAGYNKGKFLIQSGDGDFVLHPWLQFQFRNITSYREDVPTTEAGPTPGTTVPGNPTDDLQNGFEVRRMKIGFDGNVYGPNLTYLFLWATSRKGGALSLEEAWARYKFPANDFALKAGQFKDPFAHESLVSSKRLLAADRTLLTDLFTGGDNFVQGVSLGWEPKMPLRAEVAFTDGSNRFNDNFQDFPTNTANFGFSGRVEYLAFGNWKQYEDFTALDNKEDLLVFGAGADYTEAGDTDTLLHTVDAQWEYGHWGVYAAYLGRYTQNPTGGASDAYDYGAQAQVSYLLDPHWEPFARYSYIRFDGATLPSASERSVHEITGGVNYYLKGQSAKFTLDATWLPNGTPVADDGAGILADDGSNEFLLRAQFQLLL